MSLLPARGRASTLYLRPAERPQPRPGTIYAEVLEVWENRRCWICREHGRPGFGQCEHREVEADLAEIRARRAWRRRIERERRYA